MKILLLLVFTSSMALANEEGAIKSDKLYSLSVMGQFYKTMTIEEVRKIFLEKSKTIEIYNNCLQKYEYPINQCEKGHSLIATLPLPSNEPSLGKGALQMYFTFSSEQKLIENMYELYYSKHH